MATLRTLHKPGLHRTAWFGVCAILISVSSPARADDEDARPLSPAQLALFETPHLQNVSQPETLEYRYVREGGTGFTDTVAVDVKRINPDGTKNLSFRYLTGERQIQVPALDNFRGNPLLMLTLERDSQEMKDAVGLSSSFFRNKLREAFVSGASIKESSFDFAGKAVPAREITVHPFEHEDRLARLPSLQAKSYTFVLADAVPGGVAEILIQTPADATMQTPAFSQRTVFSGVKP